MKKAEIGLPDCQETSNQIYNDVFRSNIETALDRREYFDERSWKFQFHYNTHTSIADQEKKRPPKSEGRS